MITDLPTKRHASNVLVFFVAFLRFASITPQVCCCGPMFSQTDRRTDGQTDKHHTVYRPCSALSVDSADIIQSTHLGIWACGLTWRRHTGKHGSSAPHQRITQPTSCPQVASPTWSSAEQVARPATKRFRPSDWRPLEACCRPWTWWCNDATALAGYANMMMMMTMIIRKIEVVTVNINLRDFATLTQNVANDSLLTHSSCLDTQFVPHYPTRQNYLVASRRAVWIGLRFISVK